MRFQVNGILLLDKPEDMTSNYALQKIKRLFNAKKAGHTGSLDPVATGMLPICFGEATKFSQFLLESDKSYRVTAKLGEQTSTGDIEGVVIKTSAIPSLSIADIEKVMQQFHGKQQQIPPMYSAIKQQGRPLYELARRGIEVERKPREINVLSIKFEKLENDCFTFYVHCSKGTYIRTLVEDIAHQLDCCAHVVRLRRLMVTPYANTLMYTLENLEEAAARLGQNGLLAALLPVETTVQSFPAIKLTASAIFYIRMGQPVRAPFTIPSPLVRLIAEDGSFLGMGEVMADGKVKPHRMLAKQEVTEKQAV